MNFAEQFDQFQRWCAPKSARWAAQMFYVQPVVTGYEPETKKIHFTFPDGSRWEGEEKIDQ